jgi:hypothetical protein
MKDRHIGAKERTQLIFDKVTKNTQLRKNSLFSKESWKNLTIHMQKNKIGPLSLRIDSKWIKT